MAESEEAPPDVDAAEKEAGRIVIPPRPGEESLTPTAFTYSVPLTPGYSGTARPDPEGDALRARMAEQRRTGEWEDWFINLPEKQDEAMRSVGLPRQLRERAAPQLKRLYPPRVCRKLLRDEKNRQVVAALFNRWLPYIDPFIRIGLDLGVAQPWSDRKLLGDLRSFDNFATAQTELEVWASLARHGYDIDREPLGPDGRRPDFAVCAGSFRYIVEVNTLRHSDPENYADDIRQAMHHYADYLRKPGQSAKVYATNILRELLDSSSGRDRITGLDGKREFGLLGDQLRRLYDAGSPLGNYPVGDWFVLEIVAGADHPGGIVASGVWDGQSEERRAVRIASLVESALPQIPPTAEGVPVIDVGRPMFPEAVVRELRRRAQEKPVHFSPVAFVVLRWNELASPTQFRHSGTVLPFRRNLSASEARLVQALIG